MEVLVYSQITATVLKFRRFAIKTQKRNANKQSEYRQEIA